MLKDSRGEVYQYRVVAGCHRVEAARRAGLDLVPAFLFENLTTGEEVLVDRWDNELEKMEMAVPFLDLAEKCHFLLEEMGWSQKQVAAHLDLSPTNVFWKLRIARLPLEIKAILRGYHWDDPAFTHLPSTPLPPREHDELHIM